MNMKKLWLAASVAALLVCGCTTTGSGSSYDFVDTTSSEARLYGDFLVGSYADQLSDASSRSSYYSRAFERAPDNINLGRRAVTSAVTAGDMKLARKLAKQVLETHPTEPMSRAVLGVQAFANKKYDRAESYFQTTTPDLTVQVLMTMVRGWNFAANDNPDSAKAMFATIGGAGYFDILGQLQTASLEASLGEIESAEAGYKMVEAASLSPIETALSKTRALSVAGKSEDAKTHLKAFSEESGGFESGPVRLYLERLEAKDKVEVLTPQQEASRALTEASYGFFLRNRANDVAEVFLRLALELDPEHDKAKLWLGNLIENADREDEAMAIYKSVPEDSPYIVSGKLSQANIYFAREDDETAIAILEETNAAHTSFVTRESLGRARLIRENYEEALPIYDALVKSMSEDELNANPEPLYFRGICYERLKQWDKAVADFKKVLEIDPESADALNYLGYTWVDRNENLEEAFEMIRKAVALEPNSGAIVDSLGWAHYKLGQYSDARVQLEKAVELSPSSATIIDHLGDTYWKLGRFREAGYQWKRALEFDPTDEERASIKAKLEGGLDAAQALP